MDEHSNNKSSEKTTPAPPKIPTLNLPSTVPQSPSTDLFDINSFLSFRGKDKSQELD